MPSTKKRNNPQNANLAGGARGEVRHGAGREGRTRGGGSAGVDLCSEAAPETKVRDGVTGEGG